MSLRSGENGEPGAHDGHLVQAQGGGGEKQGLRGTHSRVGPWSQGTQDCLACRSQGCSAPAVLRCHC